NSLIKLNFHHFGQFKKDENALIQYVNGVVDLVEVVGVCIFTELVSKLIEKGFVIGKLWFKLPYEDAEDRKPLWEDVELNKYRMQASGRWYKKLDKGWDVPDVEEESEKAAGEENTDRAIVVSLNQVNNGEAGKDTEEDEEGDVSYDGNGEESDVESNSSDAGLSDSSESDDEVVEEDLAIFENVNYDEQNIEKRRWLNKEARLKAQEEAQQEAQQEAQDLAQEQAEMEADFAAQIEDPIEVQDISSSAPQGTQRESQGRSERGRQGGRGTRGGRQGGRGTRGGRQGGRGTRGGRQGGR
ncbi:unnamed protein product, partial [Thlaspi arvense]